ncbi:PREDICTED: ras-related protein Rab-7L1-like [Mandrillus leucophaeus]|uniref:ras-related protein Rab-7L1-like n=1 Tax=Mandrillus leucophaeus TaxID=9568 RepID=UPI0005F506DC|nr:PREDICTED: ras-related protein Rab-7L1-like [Mandrillus leucophaeus]
MGSRDHLFKVLVVGDAAVGKTSLVQRYSQDSFSKHYKSTVGVDFALKVLQWSDSEIVRLQLWDIAGQERFTSMTRLYYRDASACVIMFDVTNATTFSNSQRWKQDLDSKLTLPNGELVPCLLLANKVCGQSQKMVPSLPGAVAHTFFLRYDPRRICNSGVEARGRAKQRPFLFCGRALSEHLD